MAVLAATLFGRKGRTFSSPHDGDGFAELLLVLLLKLLPVEGVSFWFRWVRKRQRRIDPELSVVRWPILRRLQLHVLARAAEYFLKHGND
jgi:hypothetical protein